MLSGKVAVRSGSCLEGNDLVSQELLRGSVVLPLLTVVQPALQRNTDHYKQADDGHQNTCDRNPEERGLKGNVDENWYDSPGNDRKGPHPKIAALRHDGLPVIPTLVLDHPFRDKRFSSPLFLRHVAPPESRSIIQYVQSNDGKIGYQRHLSRPTALLRSPKFRSSRHQSGPLPSP